MQLSFNTSLTTQLHNIFAFKLFKTDAIISLKTKQKCFYCSLKQPPQKNIRASFLLSCGKICKRSHRERLTIYTYLQIQIPAPANHRISGFDIFSVHSSNLIRLQQPLNPAFSLMVKFHKCDIN